MVNARNGRERQKNGHLDGQTAKGLLLLLSDTADNVSELLWAALVTDGTYPELAETLERMACQEVARFRALGGILLRCGVNPTARSLLCRHSRGVRGLRDDSDAAIETFLRDMRERTEAMLEQALRVLTVPCLEGDDATARILDGQEAQLRQLQRRLRRQLQRPLCPRPHGHPARQSQFG